MLTALQEGGRERALGNGATGGVWAAIVVGERGWAEDEDCGLRMGAGSRWTKDGKDCRARPGVGKEFSRGWASGFDGLRMDVGKEE